MAIALPQSVVQGTITANGKAVVIGRASATAVGVQISGTWVGTITFQASIDGVNWTTFGTTTDGLLPFPAGTPGVNSTTANGTWTMTGFSGLVFFQAVATAWTSGTATVTLNLTAAS